MSFDMPDGTPAVLGKIIEATPPKRLVQTWQFQYDPELKVEEPSTVTWEIEPRGEACLLTVVHEFDSVNKAYEHVTHGWPEILSGLKTLLETGEPLLVTH
jgi:uncharacterized protein YndB with AHSA1/START domain